MVTFHKVVPALKVAQMDRALAFYTEILGFSSIWRNANDGDGENVMLEAGTINVLLSTGSHLGDVPAFTGTLYFNMTGVQDFFDQIKERVEIVWPLENMEYGQKEFGIRDPDGYILAFAEELSAEK